MEKSIVLKAVDQWNEEEIIDDIIRRMIKSYVGGANSKPGKVEVTIKVERLPQ